MSVTPSFSRFKAQAWLWPTLLGALLGALPHVTQRVVHGTWLFLGDNDDVYYAMIARAPFFGSWTLRDPFANAQEMTGVSYAWGLFVPMAKIASIFGNNPGAFLLAWRLVGGALLGWGLWLLLTTIVRRSGSRFQRLSGAWGLATLCAAMTAIILVDPGFDNADLPFERLIETVRDLLLGRMPLVKPGWYVQFRIVSPLCSIGCLFGLLSLLSLPQLRLKTALVAGLLLGLLFNLYFFFWTAAVGLLLVLMVLRLAPGRARRWLGVHQPLPLLLLILVVGIALGLPQFIGDFSHFGDPVTREALERTPRGIALSLHNPTRWMYLKGARLWMYCAIASLAAIRMRALRVVALLALISFALGNSAVITRLEFENYKWLHLLKTLGYLCCWVWGVHELLGALVPRVRDAYHLVRTGLLAVLTGATIIALVWLPRESLAAPEAAERTRWLRDVQGVAPILARLDPNASLAAPHDAQPALLFSPSGVLYESPHTTCSFIQDAEVIKRHVLNAWVLGDDLSRLYLDSSILPTFYGESRARWQAVRSDYVRESTQLRTSDLDKFRVRYAMHPCVAAPSAETGPWRELGRSGRWCVWERQLS